MKKIVSIIAIMIFALSITACNTAESKNTIEEKDNVKETKTEVINVYYFHFAHRCATCLAVEDETKRILNELYPERMKNKEIIFQSVSLDEKEGKILANKMKISGQTLLFKQGKKKVNLTSVAFMYARTKPEKFKAEIKKTIDNFN